MIRMIHGSTRIGVNIYSPRNGAFQTDEAIEQRLVELGVAAYVTPPTPIIRSVSSPPVVPAYDITMKMDALRAVMKEHGVPFVLGMSKVDAVAALDARFGITSAPQAASAKAIDSTPPTLGVADPVV